MSGFFPPVMRQAKTDIALPAAIEPVNAAPPGAAHVIHRGMRLRQPRARPVALTNVLGDHPRADRPGQLLHQIVHQFPILPEASSRFTPASTASSVKIDSSVDSFFKGLVASNKLTRTSTMWALHSTEVLFFSNKQPLPTEFRDSMHRLY